MSSKNHDFNIETKFELPSTISLFGKITYLNSPLKFSKLRKLQL